MNQDELASCFSEVLGVIRPVTEQFEAEGFRLYLVGGVVRDVVLGGHGSLDDIDLTTDARPVDIKRLLNRVSSTIWTQGERFGTIGAVVNGRDLEITTHRAESYDPDSRKPAVEFGDDLRTDLSRRDFSINAMAFCVVTNALHDPFDGLADLTDRCLRTPEDPAVSFIDDPLRMLRAARFIPRYALSCDPTLESAVERLGSRLTIVSRERIHDELEKLLGVEDPTLGLEFLMRTGLMDFVVPGLTVSVRATARAEMRMCARVSRLRSVAVRRAGLIASLDEDQAAAWLQDLRYSTADRKLTLALLHGRRRLLGLAAGDPQSSAGELRHIVNNVGFENMGDAFELAATMNDESVDLASVQHRYDVLAQAEDLADLTLPISGGDLICELGMSPGPAVGEAIQRLGQHRLDHGPMDRFEAIATVREWLDRSPQGN